MLFVQTLAAAMLPSLAAATLPQQQTNGNSVLGTVAAPLLPKFLTNNPLPQGFPWGTLTANGTNQYTTYPNTGVIRTYDFTVSRSTLAPDGLQKQMLLINGGFPGPTIEANWGDTIQVTVHNNITGPEEGTAMHWHGFLQQHTPWEDGVPAVTQCPIAPGASFTYQFQATLYGTAWYHSHYSAQYGDGIVGPIVVYGPSDYDYDVDVGPVMLSDYYHRDYMTLLEAMLAPGGSPEVPSDNNLIQGKNNFDCAVAATTADEASAPCNSDAGLATFHFQAGAVHRLRLINTGSDGVQRFSIDNHTLTIIAYDFVPIQAYDTTLITLGVGQRADVLVKANAGAAGAAFWMRSTIACSSAKQPNALAAVYYDAAPSSSSPASAVSRLGISGYGGYGLSGSSGAAKDSTPSGGSAKTAVNSAPPASTPWPAGISSTSSSDPGGCSNDDLARTAPLLPLAPAAPTWTHTFEIGMVVNASNVTLWTFDGVSFRGDYNAPTLLLASLGNATAAWPREWNARNLYSNSSVRLVVVNNGPSPHPMHLHGNNFYVLHEGPGAWDGRSIVRPINPMRRDVQLVRPHGHLVLQFDATNPGVWPFHCHIAWHASGGFLSQLVVQPDKIRQTQIPSIMAQTCRDWAAWTGTHVPDQIDSGL